MYTVINGIKIILLIIAGLLFFLGLGWLIVGPILQGSLTNRKRDISRLQEIPLILLAGLIINYGITLCFQTLKLSLTVEFILSIFGLISFSIYFFRQYFHELNFRKSWYLWISIIGFCSLFLSPILTEPLAEWDARSIWFFHAKMIYVAGTIGQPAGWQNYSVLFSHTDYPMLVPAVAAQVTFLFGFWNEFLPKISLFFILIPAILWLFSFARRSFSTVVLFLLIPFCFYPWIWNGYMDGILAIYFSIALLLMGRYMMTLSTIDMISSLTCLIILFYIKNEGALAAIAGLCSIFFLFLLQRKSFSIKNISSIKLKYYLAVLIGLLPLILWSFYKHKWNLSNDLNIGTTGSFLQIINRMTDSSYTLVLRSLYLQIQPALVLLVIVYFTSVVWKKPLTREYIPALIAAGLYSIGLIFIYLLTPNDLNWQISTSLNRTTLSVNGGLFIGGYFILNQISNELQARKNEKKELVNLPS